MGDFPLPLGSKFKLIACDRDAPVTYDSSMTLVRYYQLERRPSLQVLHTS